MVSCVLLGVLLAIATVGRTQQQPVRVCVPQMLSEACLQMQADLPEKWTCVIGRDKLDCARKMERNEADLTNMDSRALYVAGKYFNGIPIATELVDGQPHKYEGVALVLKDSNITSPPDLQGRRSCHTGVGRTVGWQLPIAVLLARGYMKPNCLEGELAAVEDFFSGGSCAPGNWSNDPIVDQELKKRHEKLCSRCADPQSCSSTDSYAGYEGSVRCLLEGSGDIAFTKVPVLKELLEKDPTLADRVELLCLEGGRRPVSQMNDRCIWGFRPSNAYVTSADNYERNGSRLLSVLEETQSLYPPPRVRTPDWYYKTFLSGTKVTAVQPVGEDRRDYRSYLGDFIYAIEKPRTGCTEGEDPATFCVTSEEERAKCEDFNKAAQSRGLSPPIHCVTSTSKAACMEVIKQGHAQLIALDGGDVYKAGRYYQMQPVAAETYGDLDASYYAVAVIRSASDATKLSDLKGLRSCHTGMGRTAGWVVPVGALVNHGDVNSNECNRAAAIAEFFDAGSCVPGANDTKYNPGRVAADKLCRYCIGDEEGNNKCARSSKERYSGYAGALRCLAEGRGDVAFVKHTTVPQYTDGRGSDSLWSRDLLSSDFQLLCGAKGGTSPVNDYLNCNLAKVPSHYVMTSGDANFSTRLQYARLLAEASKFFSDDSDLFRLFDKYGDNQNDLLFKDATTSLKAAPLDATYTQVLGEDFLKASEAVDPKLCTS